MSETPTPLSNEAFFQRALEVTIRIGVVVLLAAWCFEILRPFLIPVIWGIIIAVAVYPAFGWLERMLGGRSRVAAAALTAFGFLVLIVPAVVGASSLVESGQEVATKLLDGGIHVPPPPESVAEWPFIGDPVYKFWSLAANNLVAALEQLGPQLTAMGGWLLAAGAGTGLAIGQFLISILIAGVLLAGAGGASGAARRVAGRLGGERGEEFTDLAGATVRSVAVGIVGVAIIQSLLIGIGFFAVGVPHAGLWTVLCMFIAVVQLPPFLVVLPIIVYVGSTSSTTVAVIFSIWSVLAALSDNVLKPILLARGVKVPMLVIFLGSIGGFISAGFIGLFVGAVVLSLGYELFRAWIAEGASEAAS